MTQKRTALVLGATGGIGSEIARTLLARGWSVRALVRNTAGGLPQGCEARKGDALDREAVVAAAEGVDAIVHAVNPPGYRNWERVVLPMIDNTIAAARAAGGARIVLPGTIYNFDPAKVPVIGSASPQEPRSRKGMIRVELERRLEDASDEVPALIVRAGDFFGPQCRNSWFSQAMVTPGRPVRRMINPGRGMGHSWAYLPDLATAIAALLDRDESLRPFERVQFEGFWDADGTGMADAIRRVVGRSDIPERAFPWWAMRLLRPFGGFPREVVEIEAYWRHPVRLDNARLADLLGGEPRTPLDKAVAATLAGLGCIPVAHPAPAARHIAAGA